MIFDREELLSPHLDAEQVLIMFFLKLLSLAAVCMETCYRYSL